MKTQGRNRLGVLCALATLSVSIVNPDKAPPGPTSSIA